MAVKYFAIYMYIYINVHRNIRDEVYVCKYIYINVVLWNPSKSAYDIADIIGVLSNA